MEKNEIKKRLYKDGPIAALKEVRSDGVLYYTKVDGTTIYFLIPLGEVGEVVWELEMPAKLLIRWLQD